MANMMVEDGSPNLEESVNTLKQYFNDNTHDQSALTATHVYLAALHLLCELKRDHAELYRIQNKGQKSNNCACPPIQDIPAISAVIYDCALFRALIRCLHITDAPDITGAEASTTVCNSGFSGGNASVHVGSHHHHHQAGKKRSLSMSGEAAINASSNKSQKSGNHLSPIPIARTTSLSINDATRSNIYTLPKPTFNARVVAATALYTAFQYLDHWPVPLIKAYAEDCFGPRIWVDNIQCSQLVENLALTHCEESGIHANLATGDSVLGVAAKIAAAYSEIDKLEQEVHESPSKPSSRRESLGSTGSTIHCSSMLGKRALQRQESSKSAGSFDSGSSSHHISKKPRKQEMNQSSDENDVKQCDSDLSSLDLGQGGDQFTISGVQESNITRTDDNEVKTEAFVSSSSLNENEKPKTEISSDADEKERTNVVPYCGDVNLSQRAYPHTQENLDLSRVRHRYFGMNLECAQSIIVTCLSERIDIKSKQNSGLLFNLPAFATLPGVRYLIAENLEKWLQSPALAGLARNLFSCTVNHMPCIDPPHRDDLRAIESIIQMKLKANQFNAHLENITAIAKRLPIASVASCMYSTLLREALRLDTRSVITCDQLKMISAIHGELPPHVSYDALAESLLTLLAGTKSHDTDVSSTSLRTVKDNLVNKLRGVIRAIATQFGCNFDGIALIEALLSLDVNTSSWSAHDEEDRARLMYQCLTLSVLSMTLPESGKLTSTEASSARKCLDRTKKLFLSWFCTEYGPHFVSTSKDKNKSTPDEALNDFGSALGPKITSSGACPHWLRTIRCLLLMEDADSIYLKSFLVPRSVVAVDTKWEEELTRMRLLRRLGGVINNDMVRVVLRSVSKNDTGITSDMAIQLFETLFEGCGGKSRFTLQLTDPDIIWEMYNLALFVPPEPISISCKEHQYSFGEPRLSEKERIDIPRLACPGLWWRVTMLALVMSGFAPESVGAVMWHEHPTLRALIKMVTSNRYRFPTVDCDDSVRVEMKASEQWARDEETRLAEYLFLPPRDSKKPEMKKGSRLSQRILRQQQEREEARELDENIRRKKLLRAAQKLIMLWDPDCPARKPPREAVELLLSVEELFHLGDRFQQSVKPDFVLLTIGKTTRGAIERAYDWLIPIISNHPSTIARLHSSASCFLLLRAYGTEGNDRRQLKELSAPLLLHVRESLLGKHGESDSVKAFNLLMTDIASTRPDRRRCARRVLQDALSDSDEKSRSWLFSILHLDYATSLVRDAVKHMLFAAGIEKGRFFCSLVIALEKFIAFAEDQDVKLEQKFTDILVKLMSSRPTICLEAMDSFSELRLLAVRVLFTEFSRLIDTKTEVSTTAGYPYISIQLYKTYLKESGEVTITQTLLQALTVILSIWRDKEDTSPHDLTDKFHILANALLCEDNAEESTENIGLGSARMLTCGREAVSVETWIMLAKARSDKIARRAALSAPVGFLPRLLLCAGLPRASLVTMIDRLGRLSWAETNKSEVYSKLLSSPAISKWDSSAHQGILRKLFGRLEAYRRLYNVLSDGCGIDLSFLKWLNDEIHQSSGSRVKASNIKQTRGKTITQYLLSSKSASTILSTIEADESAIVTEMEIRKGPRQNFQKALFYIDEEISCSCIIEDARPLIKKCLDGEVAHLDNWLNQVFSVDGEKSQSTPNGSLFLLDVSIEMLSTYQHLQHPHRWATSLLVKWIPRLSYRTGAPALWSLMFLRNASWSQSMASTSLLSACLSRWSVQHVMQCKDWILHSSWEETDRIDFSLVSLFLISTSGQPSPSVELFGRSSSVSQDADWASTKEFVVTATQIALLCLKQSSNMPEKSLTRRNGFQPFMSLIFLLAKCGKRQLRTVSDTILQGLAKSEGAMELSKLEIIFLHLYLRHPYWMDLGSASARNTLLHAAEKHAETWTDWRSSLDDRLEDLLDAVVESELKVSRQLSELSRKHPLLILRKLPAMTSLLKAEASSDKDDVSDRRYRIVGQDMIREKLQAVYNGSVLKVSVKHWGYSFTEPLWLSLLDVVFSMPHEVLFTCGPKVGLLPFLEAYTLLISIQLQLSSVSKISRLKEKTSEVLVAFKKCNATDWKYWLGKCVGTSEIRHLLMSCDFITPQEAIQSLKDAE